MELTPVKTIELPPAMAGKDAQAVMVALGAGPGEDAPAARFVGGCVRNVLLGLAPGDIDIATQFTPEQVMTRLEDAGIRVIATGVAHGTVTAIGPEAGGVFEVTTLRRDVATDGRHAEIAFSADWLEDAKRRDFTMNTLLCDLWGRVYDPLGSGIEDLEARYVRFVGEPVRRIEEDYLRILRFFRFYAEYGRGVTDTQALEACRGAAQQVYTLARERIAQELFKILAVDNPVDVLKIMYENNILDRLFHPCYRPDALGVLCGFQAQAGQSRIAPRLLILSGLDEAHYTGLDHILTLPKAYRRAGQYILEALDQLHALNDYYYRVFVYYYGHEIAADTFFIKGAQDGANDADIAAIVARHAHWQPPGLPINGDDLQALGIERGPELGEILRQVESWWLARDFMPDRQVCLDYAWSLITDN